jgi:hypothetical protein
VFRESSETVKQACRGLPRSGLERSDFVLWPRAAENLAMQQVGSYSGHSGCGANAFGKAARDPKQTFRVPMIVGLYVTP